MGTSTFVEATDAEAAHFADIAATVKEVSDGIGWGEFSLTNWMPSATLREDEHLVRDVYVVNDKTRTIKFFMSVVFSDGNDDRFPVYIDIKAVILADESIELEIMEVPLRRLEAERVAQYERIALRIRMRAQNGGEARTH